jgi:uncharacterized OsmC-like protein
MAVLESGNIAVLAEKPSVARDIAHVLGATSRGDGYLDEPSEQGDNDAGLNPEELILAALGSCASITVQMCADRKQWPLEAVPVHLVVPESSLG